MGRLDGKVAIVTGAGQGVGRGIALAFAKEGARIVIAEINPDTCKTVEQEISKLGTRALGVVTDVSKEDQVKKMVAETVRVFGGIDILVNNAQTVPPVMALEDGTDEWWDAYYNTGPKATWYCCKAVFPHMKAKGGKIINLGSRAGIAGFRDVGYASCKEAIRGFTRRAAREWGKYGICVNVICPASRTPALDNFEKLYPEQARKHIEGRPIPRWGDPETDIAPTVVYLASKDSDYVTGQTINVNGGDHMF